MRENKESRRRQQGEALRAEAVRNAAAKQGHLPFSFSPKSLFLYKPISRIENLERRLSSMRGGQTRDPNAAQVRMSK